MRFEVKFQDWHLVGVECLNSGFGSRIDHTLIKTRIDHALVKPIQFLNVFFRAGMDDEGLLGNDWGTTRCSDTDHFVG